MQAGPIATDSGFYQDLIGHKPQYGFVIYWAGGPLIWRSKKHTIIPLNTSEAEYMALCHAWRHIKWLRNVLTAMGLGWMVANATRAIGDNKNANDWAREKMITDGNRHVDICYMKGSRASSAARTAASMSFFAKLLLRRGFHAG